MHAVGLLEAWYNTIYHKHTTDIPACAVKLPYHFSNKQKTVWSGNKLAKEKKKNKSSAPGSVC